MPDFSTPSESFRPPLKVLLAAPRGFCAGVDRAIQIWGAAGVSNDLPLWGMYQGARTLRIADGPDEVHKMTIARREILRHDPSFRMNPALGGPSKEAEPQPFMRP